MLIFKGKYITCQMRHTRDRSGYVLPGQRFLIWYVWIFMKLHLKRVQKCHLDNIQTFELNVKYLPLLYIFLVFALNFCKFLFQIPMSSLSEPDHGVLLNTCTQYYFFFK